ncbi:M9 family metallopeptidase [Microbacterium sp. Mu-80]|uniref:microbial collagenase n=1 Tax=Microbacterium bandirmense TaxID=3122050 RepID=A0ABU8LBA2_9MICO
MTSRMMHRGATMLLSVAVCAGLVLAVPTAAAGSAPTAASPTADETAPPYISGLVSPESDELAPALPPISANTDALRTGAGEDEAAPERPSMQQRSASKNLRAAAATCTTADFAQASSASVADLVTASTTDCVNTLFSVTGTQAAAVFSEAKMVAVANTLKSAAQSYTGDNSASTTQLVLFLRAGYYVQYYDSNVPDFGTALRTAVSGALDTFFGNPRSQDVTDANGETLSEAVTLIDSAELNDRYIHVVKRLLTDYDSSYDSSWWMLNAVNGTFTVLFRGHQVPAFVDAVAADGSLLVTLRDFALGHTDLLSGQNAYLVTNAGRELGRFLGDAQVKAVVKPHVKSVLDQTSLDGPASGLWVAVAQMADWYDASECSYYGTCNLQERIEAHVLPTTHVCSQSITIRAQDMNAEELSDSCDSLNAQDAYFHSVAKDDGPVPDDVNTTIEVVVFDSSDDYQSYAGSLYGIDTNNGGMYLEGDPSQVGNIARFIAYEADWLRPEFAIWNLNHEYTHYLDGRFNMHGDFAENMTTPTIWWVEGFAEYISYHYRDLPYTAAQELAATGQYTLSELFDTTYDHDTDRIYRWGYLAVSFMLNQHPNEMQTVLGDYRSGNWSSARNYLKNSIGTAYDAEFADFLTRCAQGDCSDDLGGGTPDPGPDPDPDPGENTWEVPVCDDADARLLGQACGRMQMSAEQGDSRYLLVWIPEGTDRLTVTSGGGLGDADLYVSHSGWASPQSHTGRSTNAGNSEQVIIEWPASGWNYITLHGVEDFSNVSVVSHY